MALLITSGVLQVVVVLHCFYCSFSAATLPVPTTENVALQRLCQMSSEFTGDGFSNGCGAAVNGNTGTTFTSGNCIHTATTDLHPRWTVFLGQNYQIKEIVVYMRDGNNQRRTNITIVIDNDRVYHEDGDAGGVIRVPSQHGAITWTGRSVTVARDGYSGDPNSFLLNICEVQVWALVCPRGYYPNGDQCLSCGHCANNGVCDNSTGHCSNGCEPGYKETPTCHMVCDAFRYGNNCQQICNIGCGGNGECDKVNGDCTSPTCKPGYRQSDKCDQTCDAYHYGHNCQQNCGAGCGGDGTCNKENGICTYSTCKTGYRQTVRCDQPCDDLHYGVNCQQKCSAGCGGDGACDKVTGDCMAPICKAGNMQSAKCDQHCTDGYYWNNCILHCGHCADNATCDKTNGYCPALCSGSYQPPLCQTYNTKNSNSPVIGSIVGVGAFIGVSVIILAIVMWKRRSRNETQIKTVPDDSNNKDTETGFDNPLSSQRSSPVTCTDRPSTDRKGQRDGSEVYVEVDSMELQRATTGSAQGGHSALYYNVAETNTNLYDKATMPCQNTDEDGQLYEKMTAS